MNIDREDPVGAPHEFIAATPDGVPGCTCGWAAAGSTSPGLAHKRWQLHVYADHAEVRRSEAICLTRLVRARATELRARRTEVKMRRATAMTQRANLARHLNSLRQAAAEQHVVRHGNVLYLDRARRMADLDVTGLWLGYLGLGGNGPFERIRRSLNGLGPLSVADFNLLALAINETFCEMGFGYPIDYLVASRRSLAAGA